MEYYKVEYNGGSITHDGAPQTYAQLVEKYHDDAFFLFAEANGLTMIPALPPLESDPILEFTCSWIEEGETKISRLIINNRDQVKFEDKTLVESSNLPEGVKQAMTDDTTWTEAEQTAAQKKLGIVSAEGVKF